MTITVGITQVKTPSASTMPASSARRPRRPAGGARLPALPAPGDPGDHALRRDQGLKRTVPPACSSRRERGVRTARWSLLATVLASTVAIGWASGHDAVAWTPQPGTLLTRWAADVDTARAARVPAPADGARHWLNLNGPWEYAVASADAAAGRVRRRPAGALPGRVGAVRRACGASAPTQRLWYRRTLRACPPRWRGRRVLLHFGAVDWEATVWVNGAEARQPPRRLRRLLLRRHRRPERPRHPGAGRPRSGTRPTPATSRAASRC